MPFNTLLREGQDVDSDEWQCGEEDHHNQNVMYKIKFVFNQKANPFISVYLDSLR